METINVKIAFLDEPITVNVDGTTTVEDVIIAVCKRLNIRPITRPLFALKFVLQSSQQLKVPANPTWLNLSYLICEAETKNFEFALRFNVDNDRLKDIDEVAYDFYFKQAKHTISEIKIPQPRYEEHKSEIIGLGVIDMFRAHIEDGLDRDVVIANYMKYVPTMAKKKHKRYLQKPMIDKFNEIRLRNVSITFIKSGYLEQFHKIVPDYLIEQFRGVVNTNMESVYQVHLRVNPFDKELPGIAIKYENKDAWEHFCTIDELCYITRQSDGTVRLSRKNGIPLDIKFHTTTAMISFITVLDGYYRLMAKWTFNLCSDYKTPSLINLRRLKCHGPVSGEFAYRKLMEKGNNQPGYYILRESDLSYDTYYMDVCTKTRKPVTYKIVKTERNTYKLAESVEEYQTLTQLLNEEHWENYGIELTQCLPPSEFDQSNLLLCQVDNNVHVRNQSTQRGEKPSSFGMPVCIDARNLMVFKNMPRGGHNPNTIVYRSVWKETPTTKRDVAIKVLRDDSHQKYLTEFLSLTSKWAFVNAGALVKLYGITLSTPVSMVMEYLPYGQLDEYLANPENQSRLKEVTLVEASAALANALYYMEEAKFIHGYIRCRKLLVAEHTEKFIVKLADPGLRQPYRDHDLHWIPPELHNDTVRARESVSADVWAFATTLWEIFSYGKSPFVADANTIKKFYEDPAKRLPIPAGCPQNLYYLMQKCWHYDVDSRKNPQAIMRDINEIFYQIYNSRQGNPYARISPRQISTDDDTISHKSDVCTSVPSEFTVDTTLADTYSGIDADYQLRKTPIADHEDERLTTFSGIKVSSEDASTSISSTQTIYELSKEWNLIFHGRIGMGFYGDVFRGQLLHLYEDLPPQQVAVKIMKKDAMKVATNCRDFRREVDIMKSLNHPNIVKIKGVLLLEDPNPDQRPDLCLVLEYIDHGSLACYLAIHKEQLTTHHLLKFSLDIAQGMKYLSEKRIVHRDLAARNILVVNESHVKISDFGLARFIGNNNYYLFETNRHLPLKWYAPESIEHNKFSIQSDVWSYGVTLFEMFSFGAEPNLPNVDDSTEEFLKALKENVRLPMPLHCPQYIYANVMIPCWNIDASLRPTFEQLCKIIIEDICLMSHT